MKNFSFKMSDLNSIFNSMNEGEKKNFDSYLDKLMSKSLSEEVSGEFTSELMKRIEIEREFAREDIKTSRIARYIIGVFVTILAVIAVAFAFSLKVNDTGKDAGIFNYALERFSGMIESISMFISSNLGFGFSFQTGIILLVIMACVFLFSFADKVIFRKGYK